MNTFPEKSPPAVARNPYRWLAWLVLSLFVGALAQIIMLAKQDELNRFAGQLAWLLTAYCGMRTVFALVVWVTGYNLVKPAED